MRYAGYDTETHLIQPGLLTPPLVCGSIARYEAPVGGQGLVARDQHSGVITGDLLTREESIDQAREILDSSDTTIVVANGAYDFAVLANERPDLLESIFRAFAEGRVHDVQVAMALHYIALGFLFKDPETGKDLRHDGKKSRYNLDMCCKMVLGRDDAKDRDFWRGRYAILQPLAHELWPEDARQYPCDDAVNTLEVGLKQLADQYNNLSDLPAQVETAFAMHLGAVWGIRTSRERVFALREKTLAWHKAFVERFQQVGFIRGPEAGKDQGKEDSAAVKRAVARAYGASGTCEVCEGTGKVRKVLPVPCRGLKVKGRFKGCLRDVNVQATIQVPEPRTQGLEPRTAVQGADGVWFVPESKMVEVSELECSDQLALTAPARCGVCQDTGFTKVLGNEINCRLCDGTGLDLETAPTLPRTASDGVSTNRDTLSETDDQDLHDYSDNEPDKILKTYLPFLLKGVDRPINLRPNVLVESGRTSYDGPIQLIPKFGGVRECFEARLEYVFCDVDFSAIELCTLSQVCLWVCGYSKMAETINRTKNPGSLHTAFAAHMVGCSFDDLQARIKAGDEVAAAYRQASKAANFGWGGGMGTVTLVLSKRKKSEGTTKGPDGRVYTGLRFCILVGGATECGTEKIIEWKGRPTAAPVCKACVEAVEYHLRPMWFEQWPEVREYHQWVTRTLEQTDGVLPCFGPWAADGLDGWETKSHRVRGGIRGFNSGANAGFQSLAADGAKLALRRVVRESYLDRQSPLWGTRVIFFAHDANFSEMPAATAHLAGPYKAKIMIQAMKEWVPDIFIDAEAMLMHNWDKRAKPVHDASGKLIPWVPKKKD